VNTFETLQTINMLSKRYHWQSNKFCKFFIVFFLSLIVSCFLFAVLNNRTGFHFVIIRFSINAPSIKTHECTIHECTIEQSQKHGDLFASFPPAWSGCYGDFYLTAFDNHDRPVEVLIDVGANKAYAVATWLAFFLPELGINQAGLGEYIKTKKRLPEACGSCNDCQDEGLKHNNTQQKVKLQIHAFEPQPGTVGVLNDIKNWMNISERSDTIFEVHGMAVSK